MVGVPGVPIMAESLIKLNIRDSIYIHSIEQSLHTDSPVAPWSLLEKYGYIPNDLGENFAVSKTLEMCYAYGCAAELFRKMGNKSKSDYYYQKSKQYKNLYDPATGFFRGKNSKGAFTIPFDAKATDEKDFVEATPWQYLFHIQHDIDGMITLMGGKDQFISKLDALFTAEKGEIDDHILDITGLIGQYAHGNEPSHHVAYLYNYAGQPWKTQEKIHEICGTMYHDRPDGLCGNEDCGQMSAWYIFSALGFYPVHPASGMYSIGKPIVKNAKIKLPNQNIFEVKTKNYHPDYKYVKKVTLNGKRLSEPYISNEDIAKGGILEFELSEKIDKGCYRK
jgi:predicted alpha-1,2-mannosidase